MRRCARRRAVSPQTGHAVGGFLAEEVGRENHPRPPCWEAIAWYASVVTGKGKRRRISSVEEAGGNLLSGPRPGEGRGGNREQAYVGSWRVGTPSRGEVW